VISLLIGSFAYNVGATTTLLVGQVGYAVRLHDRDRPVVAQLETSRLHIHAVYKDGEPTLYGFLDEGDRHAFAKLLEVQGVGPSVALKALSVLRPSELQVAVSTGDTKALRFLGVKTAQNLIEAAR
jgi:Holliday junction DNA helicase RuvA